MAYTPQSFVAGQVLTADQCNQVETNIRDHVHGSAGVVSVNPLWSELTRAESNMQRTSAVGFPGSYTTIATLGIASLQIGDKILFTAQADITKGTSGGMVNVVLNRNASGVLFTFAGSISYLGQGAWHGAGDLQNYHISGIATARSAGNAFVNLIAISNNSSASAAAETGIQATVFRNSW